ncbi:hypothetical protein ACIBU0_29855 [Streptomyces sp. NPDC049627]|uniref:hypothetical protein n=1 Tax=Streptomyces sp. NPDC049627 TaxID=3365595 RepID=UPI003795CD08
MAPSPPSSPHTRLAPGAGPGASRRLDLRDRHHGRTSRQEAKVRRTGLDRLVQGWVVPEAVGPKLRSGGRAAGTQDSYRPTHPADDDVAAAAAAAAAAAINHAVGAG